jgi:hypothetical protein
MRAVRSIEPEGFAEFWAAYPRRVGKDAARKAHVAAVKRGASVGAILQAVRDQQWPDEARFIPHPATWLNQGRWQDDPNAAAPPERKMGKTDWLHERPGKLDWVRERVSKTAWTHADGNGPTDGPIIDMGGA